MPGRIEKTNQVIGVVGAFFVSNFNVMIKQNTEELADQTVFITTFTLNNLFNYHSGGGDAVTLYLFYQMTAKWQKTNRIFAVDLFCRKRLHWGKKRLNIAKRILEQEKLITKIQGRDNGMITKWYIQVNYIFKAETVKTIENILKIRTLEQTKFKAIAAADISPNHQEASKQEAPKATSGLEDANALNVNTLNALKINKEIPDDFSLSLGDTVLLTNNNGSEDDTLYESDNKRKSDSAKTKALDKEIKSRVAINDYAEDEKVWRLGLKHLVQLLEKLGEDIFWFRFTILSGDNFRRQHFNKTRYIYKEIKGFIETDETLQLIFYDLYSRAVSTIRDEEGNPLEYMRDNHARMYDVLNTKTILDDLKSSAMIWGDLDKYNCPEIVNALRKIVKENKIIHSDDWWLNKLGKGQYRRFLNDYDEVKKDYVDRQKYVNQETILREEQYHNRCDEPILIDEREFIAFTEAENNGDDVKTNEFIESRAKYWEKENSRLAEKIRGLMRTPSNHNTSITH